MTERRDLSTFHQPISDLIVWPSSKEEWEKYKLTDEQVNHFKEFGYVCNIKILEDWQIERLNEELEKISKPDHPGHDLFHEYHANEATDPGAILFHALGAWRLSPAFHDVLWNPYFVMAASQLLGNKAVRFWHDQLFYKPARHGGVVAWHQDYSYWTRTQPLQHLTCWVGLDDATAENGCMYYVPKSHTWGLLQKPELAGDMEGLMNYLTPEQKVSFQPVPIELKKGYGSFHHPLLVHGSYANNSPRPRRAFVLNAFADGTLSDTDDELLAGVPVISKGKKITGQFFPLLFSQDEE